MHRGKKSQGGRKFNQFHESNQPNQSNQVNQMNETNQNNQTIQSSQHENRSAKVSKRVLNTGNKPSSISEDSIKKILLFPGEDYEFNEKLIHYDAFGFNNGNLVAKRCGVLLADANGKVLEDSGEEVFRSLGKYYSPKVDDPVLGIIIQKSSEFYKVDINSYTSAILNAKDFEGATKKQKPNLNLGDVVFARVSKVNKFDAPTLSCINPLEQKNWASGESFFGNIKGGNLFSFNRLHTWYFYKDNYAMSRLNDVVGYEIIIGFNGRMLVNSDKPEDIYTIHDILINSLNQTQEQTEKDIHHAFIDKMKDY